MSELLSPRATVSANCTAALLGRKPRTVAKLIAAGLLVDVGEGHWRQITIESIGDVRGSPVTLAEYGAAKARLNHRYVAREARRHAAA